MTSKTCCRNCKHCAFQHSSVFSICKIRGIKIHHEISVFAFCHHWSKKEPALPILKPKSVDKTIGKQLDFGKVLVSKEK